MKRTLIGLRITGSGLIKTRGEEFWKELICVCHLNIGHYCCEINKGHSKGISVKPVLCAHFAGTSFVNMYERRKLIKSMSKKPIYQILNTVKTFLFFI